MKATAETNKKTISGVIIAPELNQYDHVILFPEKLEQAKEHLKKAGLPKIPKAKHS